MEKRGKVTDPMTRAVAAWEKLKEVYARGPGRHRLRTVLLMFEPNDYEFLDCLLIQIEPAEIKEIVPYVLRSCFRHRRHLIAWDQLRDKTWNLEHSKMWHHTLRGLDPSNCKKYDEFIANGGYAGIKAQVGV